MRITLAFDKVDVARLVREEAKRLYPDKDIVFAINDVLMNSPIFVSVEEPEISHSDK